MAASRTREIIGILNKAAGTHRPEAADLLQRLAAEHGGTAEIIMPERGADLAAIAKNAVARKPDVIVAGGGDGTISTVAAAVAGTETALGVLPLGTLNHFAKDLGVPLETEAAIRTILTGRITEVDIGRVNEHVFVNNSSLGLYPSIVKQREAHQRRGSSKWIAFVKALVYVLQNHASIYLRIKVDDSGAEIRKTPFLFIGNNKYEIAGLNIGKRTSLAGETIWVCRAPNLGRWGLLRLTLRALTGRLRERDLEATEAKEIWIETRLSSADVAADGEVKRLATPLRYRSEPKALKVIVPAETG